MARGFRAAIVERFGAASELVVRERTLGDPGAADVLVAVHAASVTPLDTYLRSGVKVGDYTPSPPYTPGAAFAGVVAALGPDAGRFKIGDRVYGRASSGSNAEFAFCREGQIFPLPARIAYREGALIAVPFETAYYSLVDLACGNGGDVVLVQGAAGAVGWAAVQVARALGMTVLATCSQRDIAKVIENGAHAAFDFSGDVGTAIMAQTQGRGVDIVIEVSARANLALDMKIAAAGARIIVVGGTGDTAFNALPVIAKGLKILGVDLRAMPPRRLSQVNAAIVAGLEGGIYRPRIGKSFALDDIAKAHAAVESGSASGGVVLEIRGQAFA